MTSPLSDTLHTAVGFGVLGLQELQVQRRLMQRRLRALSRRVEATVDPVLDDLEGRLPEGPPRLVLHQARSAARSARRLVLGEDPPGKAR